MTSGHTDTDGIGLNSGNQKWPKVLAPLTPEEKDVHDRFMAQWHELLPNKYGRIEHFNHGMPVKMSRPGFRRTIEIGAGLGEHLRYERLTPEQEREYYAVELRPNMAERIFEAYPAIHAVVGDCQERLDFPDGYFDRYLAIHVLEHLPNLPSCIAEAWRLLDKSNGQLVAVIPCEGGLAYAFARRISSQRIFERTYGMPYSRFISREHINVPAEILEELDRYFVLEEKRFFPFRWLPAVTPNLVIALSLRPRPDGPV
jgi:SAM-dependent methyltransferase